MNLTKIYFKFLSPGGDYCMQIHRHNKDRTFPEFRRDYMFSIFENIGCDRKDFDKGYNNERNYENVKAKNKEIHKFFYNNRKKNIKLYDFFKNHTVFGDLPDFVLSGANQPIINARFIRHDGNNDYMVAEGKDYFYVVEAWGS